MIEAVCRAQALLAVMSDCDRNNWFARGRARGMPFRHRVEMCAVYLIDRIRDAPRMPGEVLEEFSTVRGLAGILKCKKSAAWTLLQRFKSLEAFAHREIKRRWETKTRSPTEGSNPYWWMPTIWRLGPALSKFFEDALGYDTNIAALSLGSQSRTRVNSPSAGGFSEADEEIFQSNQSFKNREASCPVLAQAIAIDALIEAPNRLNAKLSVEGERAATMVEAEEARRSVQSALDRLAQPKTQADCDRRQRAQKALAQAVSIIELATLAQTLRMAPPRHVDPRAPSRPPEYR